MNAKRARNERTTIDPMVACPGEAHRNPHIDNCGICLPYGWSQVPASVFLAFSGKAKENGENGVNEPERKG